MGVSTRFSEAGSGHTSLGTCPWAHLITYMVSYRDHQCKIILIKTCFHRFYCFGTVVHAFKRKLLVAIIVCRDPV